MKKIIIVLTIFLISAISHSQSLFFNDTVGTVVKRITALETNNFSSTLNPLVGKQYVTITGYASGDLDFSIGDSLFAAKTSISFGSGKAILIYNLWLPKYTTPFIWFKSASGSINVDIQIRTF